MPADALRAMPDIGDPLSLDHQFDKGVSMDACCVGWWGGAFAGGVNVRVWDEGTYIYHHGITRAMPRQKTLVHLNNARLASFSC